MADDLKDRGEPDRSRISLSEEHEVRYWTDTLRISEQQLREIVGRVGNSPDKVREVLK